MCLREEWEQSMDPGSRDTQGWRLDKTKDCSSVSRLHISNQLYWQSSAVTSALTTSSQPTHQSAFVLQLFKSSLTDVRLVFDCQCGLHSIHNCCHHSRQGRPIARFLSSTLAAGTEPQCGGRRLHLDHKASSTDLSAYRESAGFRETWVCIPAHT